MKIIIYNASLALGGAERVTVYLAKYLKNKNIETKIVTTTKSEKEYSISENVERKVLFKKGQKVINLLTVIKLRRFLKKEKPDILLVMGTPFLIYAIPACLGIKTKVIVSERNSPKNFSGKKVTKFISEWLFSYADGYIFQTNEASKYYKNISKNKVVIPNPLFKDNLPSIYSGERRKEIVNVARLHSQKNQKMLIEAFNLIADKYSSYNLIIYGEGPERDNLEELIKKLNLEERVFMPGSFPNVLEKIRISSIFAFSSDYEGMPNALIEAMALGLPVVATDCPCGGPRELINNEINGLLVPVGDTENLSKKIDYLLSNKEEATLIGNKASEIRKTLDSEKIGDEWLKFCAKISRN